MCATELPEGTRVSRQARVETDALAEEEFQEQPNVWEGTDQTTESVDARHQSLEPPLLSTEYEVPRSHKFASSMVHHSCMQKRIDLPIPAMPRSLIGASTRNRTLQTAANVFRSVTAHLSRE